MAATGILPSRGTPASLYIVDTSRSAGRRRERAAIERLAWAMRGSDAPQGRRRGRTVTSFPVYDHRQGTHPAPQSCWAAASGLRFQNRLIFHSLLPVLKLPAM